MEYNHDILTEIILDSKPEYTNITIMEAISVGSPVVIYVRYIQLGGLFPIQSLIYQILLENYYNKIKEIEKLTP